MCFSATASFIAGVSLTAAGAVSMSLVKKPSHSFFAAIPILFGAQQICEGFVWLSFYDPDFMAWHLPAKYGFLLFAQIIWPFWIPLAFLKIEPSDSRKRIIRWFLAGGIAVSILLAARLILYPAEARMEGCHIAYDIGSTVMMKFFTAIFYLGSIVIAPFFSSWRMATVLASVNVISLLTTQLFFEVYFVSVWCFFAAVQSVLIVFVMREIREKSLTQA